MLILDYDYEMDIAVQREEAKQEGHKEGIEQGTLETAKNFKKLGVDIQKIAEATGISLKELEIL